MEATTTLFIPRAGLIEEIRRDPEFAVALVTLLSRRLRRLAGLVESLSLREVPGRLAAFLLLLSERQQGPDRVVLDMPKTQLAALIGTIPGDAFEDPRPAVSRGDRRHRRPAAPSCCTTAIALRALAEGTRRLG